MSNDSSSRGKSAAKPADSGEAEVQATVDAENERGYRGTAVDPTPRENYTLAGVSSDAPTPERDRAAAKAVRDLAEGDGTSR